MKKESRLALALILIPLLMPFVEAATQFTGGPINVNQFNGNTVSTNSGAIDNGTLRVVPANGSSFGVSGSTVQVTGLNGTPLATAANQATAIASLATIANTITSTVAVHIVDNPLPVSFTQPVSVTGSTVVVTGLNGGPLSVTSQQQASTTVTKSSVTATSTSTQLLPAQSTRVGVECTALCTNTDYVFLNINSASAAVITDYPMSACSSWNPPAGMVPTGAIQVIANSGSQVVRCVSYTP